jgi:uncharacterized damage-inducible protein DinB
VSRSPLSDAFAHHIWATQRLIDVCLGLDADQLRTAVPGTYGSIDLTVRHLVGSDCWYLYTLDGDRAHMIDEDHVSFGSLRETVTRNGPEWQRIVTDDPDPDRMIVEIDEDDGYATSAALGIRLAQALHHGTDHRSQICTALTAIGIDPPSIDVWDYGLSVERMVVVQAAVERDD